MPKQTLKIQGFHGGINSNSDPRDIQDIESPDLVDVNIDALGRIKTLGIGVESDANTNSLAILPNQGLFVMSSDRKISSSGAESNENLIFVFNDTSNNIDVLEKDGTWTTGVITLANGMTDLSHYIADGHLRIFESGFAVDAQSNRFYGYLDYKLFATLNAKSGTAVCGWSDEKQEIATPTDGKCLISTPHAGSNTEGINSSAAEYIGTTGSDSVVDDGGANNVVATTAVNLRVGLQYTKLLENDVAAYSSGGGQIEGVTGTNDADANNGSSRADYYPFVAAHNQKWVDATANDLDSNIWEEAQSYKIDDKNDFVFPFLTTASEWATLDYVQIRCTGSGSAFWQFPKASIIPDVWNLLVCSIANMTSGDFSPGDATDFRLWVYNTKADSAAFYTSGPVVQANCTLTGFQPGLYSFHHTYLYDELKQESLPYKFDKASNSNDANAVNVVGGAVLFNFDIYISPLHTVSKRINGSRIYYKIQENDNYFLIGEVDFINKGFKWFPEGDIMSYDAANTSNTTTNTLLATMAIIKGISPNSANIIDTFKSINGFSGSTKNISAKAKTAVVQGRRAYIGNIQTGSGSEGVGEKFPDRILKSQVNKFDVFPDSLGKVDVSINDGESIIKLEAFADRVLQFKERTLYIINVSENVDFLEDTYQNKGCGFKYHVTKTDFGIAWFNSFGVYFYDGREVSNLLEKNNIRMINEFDWEAFIKGSFTDTTCNYNNGSTITHDDDDGEIKANLYVSGSSTDSTDIPSRAYVSSVTSDTEFELSVSTINGIHSDETLTFEDTDGVYSHIGYIPKKRQILIKNHLNDVFIYDFVLKAWMKGSVKIPITTAMTNFAIDGDQNLFYINAGDSGKVTWNPTPSGSSAFVYETKDLDFGEPGVRKKIYKVYISYKGNASHVQVHYGIDGLPPALTFNNITSGTNGKSSNSGTGAKCIPYDAGTTDWLKAELKPSASINNINSFRLKISGNGSDTIAADFEINDITVIYRLKSIR